MPYYRKPIQQRSAKTEYTTFKREVRFLNLFSSYSKKTAFSPRPVIDKSKHWSLLLFKESLHIQRQKPDLTHGMLYIQYVHPCIWFSYLGDHFPLTYREKYHVS